MSKHQRSGWSNRQRIMFIRACNAARWDTAHRYMVMHHCGCPLDPETKRPSVKHPRNTNHQLELVMSFAEPVAREMGKPLNPPSRYKSWQDAVEDRASRTRRLAYAIVKEACKRAPAQFNDGLEPWVVDHVCGSSKSGFMDVAPESFDQCDGPTIYRVVECLKAYIGRRFTELGIKPNSFIVPRSARERAKTTTG